MITRITVLIVVALSVGCAPVLKSPIGDEGDERAIDRLDHGYSILLELMKDEAKVDQILAIKSVSKGTNELLKSISATANDTIEQVNGSVKLQPLLLLGKSGLPTIESDARSRIANTQTVRLLVAGESFELKILLTQEKAMGYATALAESLAAADPNEKRTKMMEAFAKKYADLETKSVDQITALIKAKK